MNPPDPNRRVGSADIAGMLRREIAVGELAPKDKLPAERVLAQNYGVARGTVRDALIQLANEGLVHVRAGSGTYVSDQQTNQAPVTNLGEQSSAQELYETRLALEPAICGLAAVRATSQDLDSAGEQIEVMAMCGNDPDKFFAADLAFLTILTESTGNQLLIQLTGQITELRKRKREKKKEKKKERKRENGQDSTTSEGSVDPAFVMRCCAGYRQVLSTIRARDAQRAESQMKEHLNSVQIAVN
jgi:GntR family uxuAB operon transcriptional repressor